jgi:hypothetical protein
MEAVACTGARKQYIPWARLLKRVFGIDIEICPHCQGKLTIIAVIEEPAIIAKILKHLGLPTRAPPRMPARYRDILGIYTIQAEKAGTNSTVTINNQCIQIQ